MRRIFILAVALLVVTAGAFFVYQIFTPVLPPTTPPEVSDTPANAVSSDGTIIPIATSALGFNTSGRVQEVLVREGDYVKRGAVLARLDDAALRRQIAPAEKAVAVAQAQFTQLQVGATDAQRTAAQARLDAALKNYARVRAGPTQQDLAARQTEIDNAFALLKQAQAAYDRVGGASNPEIGMLPQTAQLEAATNNYNAARAALEDAQKHPTASELAAAWAEVQAAQSIVDSLNPTAETLAVARAQVAQAQAALDALLDSREDYVLLAPFDGVITNKNLEIGNIVSAPTSIPAFVLADTSKLQVETTDLAEVDVPRVAVGQTATITLDAFPEKVFRGRVSRIAPAASEHRGDKVFTVWIDLEQGTASGLRPGMTTQVEIEFTAPNPG